ncbi:hypothetical protein [Mucilaginibacter myungsuensis]|uniref:DUF2306 domain-containing protein n=1 Tax=Mucilaginibacter myungsuensis TaxID=649104 RepID=A0A929PWG8_9SPHI|nr:hypothetical protein [Mucilaginibacter myungsuensis]MBE9662119.1 hypothetical protein [Mucilaginibacter myungsuensis]MDN3599447.1 hypothetical protein [Mucilaginibacter myungsuensis]
MPNHLSTLGIIHTIISIFALIAAFVALPRYGRISPRSATGKVYIFLTVITCLTGFPIMRFGHPSPGHFLGLIILLILPVAVYARSIKFLGQAWAYVEVILMSTTLFLSLVPAVNETLTRLPIEAPLATGPDSPILKMSLLVLLLLYFAGVTYQVIKLKKNIKLSGRVVM